ncbi:MAG: metallopeptidase family protein [Thermoanaerobaculia bacterium]
MSREQFEQAVAEALDELPDELAGRLDNVVVQVEDEPTDEELLELGMDPETETLFGLYHGVALGDRDPGAYSALPDRIVVYRLPLLESCASRRELLREIRLTVRHELGHYFGLEEDELP